ncbi:hypothetical protein NDU88_001147 [Pleurodeles waltl]|uniref:Uncharacterized protein n=1 Tax=Pleurodeles waltl TaxID=8319 RepID=A0AAV7W0L8_PLEWA|nr:hypothetical protein NDU88_001147 [Pleurodeles waltl]
MCFLGTVSCGKVLVWPAEASHWINIKTLLQELSLRGHDVTVLVHPGALLIDYDIPSPYNFEVFTTPITKEIKSTALNQFLHFWMQDLPKLSYWTSYGKMQELLARLTALEKQVCDSLLLNKTLVEKLRAQKFDIFLSDPVV